MDSWFWERVMATEGDLTVGRRKLDAVANQIANNYLQFNISPCYTEVVKYCVFYGFNYDSLLEEEKDYLDRKVEGLING